MSGRRRTAIERLLDGELPRPPAGASRCPLCKSGFFLRGGEPLRPDGPQPPAVSRADNATLICSDCGQQEALRGFPAADKQLRRELWG